jgi:hypothetical protein
VDLLPVGLLVAVVLVGAGLLFAALSRRRAPQIDLRFTPHAIERMSERRVDQRAVQDAVGRPDRVIATTYTDVERGEERDSVRLEKDFRDRTLKVWVPPDWRTRRPVAVKSVAWQHLAEFTLPRGRIGAAIGRGGQNVRHLEQIHDVRISIDGRTGRVRVLGDDRDAVRATERRIRTL